ncbi:hypothetical protein HanPSC8_Chr16g0726751 [Helianthus annuus]|nr:hypothetical protein HanHA89_Chr16g0669261 [Helianthus annuus]KAJ0641592.1 hypothetical protein HanLR1_Chr16g0628971 [Helianthus annuus]KAJ0821989.1 hypothetical protein HanPSC8_Chr16g0726751 [Helianthus annuus]
MASIRFVALLLVLIIASSVSNHLTGVGAQKVLKMTCTTSCCRYVNCEQLCKEKESESTALCKPDEKCNGYGGLCCCAS